MSITRDEVAHLARLSRLALSNEELDHLAPQLDQIISAVAQVQEVAAEGIPPTSHATGLTNVFRDDEPAPCLTPEQALSGAPAVGSASTLLVPLMKAQIAVATAGLLAGGRGNECRPAV